MIGIIIDTSLIDNNKYNNNCILFFVSSSLSISSRYCVSCFFFFVVFVDRWQLHAQPKPIDRCQPAPLPSKGLRNTQPGQLKDDCEVEKVTVEACYPDRRAVVWGKRTFDHCEGFRSGPRPLLERSSLAPCRYTIGSKVMSPSIPLRWRVGRCAC